MFSNWHLSIQTKTEWLDWQGYCIAKFLDGTGCSLNNPFYQSYFNLIITPYKKTLKTKPGWNYAEAETKKLCAW